MDAEAEKLKIQKLQLYLQFASVLISGLLVYTIMKGNKSKELASEIEDESLSGLED